MSWWNYRVIRKRHADGSVIHQIHEVHYGNDGTIGTWTQEPVTPTGQELGDLREVVGMINREAFRYPVLEEGGTDGSTTLLPALAIDPVNAGHYVELLDRVFVAGEYLKEFLGSHPVVKKHGTLRTTYDKAEEALAELYVHLGGLAIRKDR